MKVCKKCGNVFKNRVFIDGEYKILKNRSFCLECSPWGKHNTKDLIKAEILQGKIKCARCGEVKDKECFSKKTKTTYHSYCKECLYLIQKNRWIKIKKEAVEYKGGKCIICGYNKNISALVFHHRDPSQKEFDWNRLRLRSKKTILMELDKCDLYCCRCHTELHNPQLFLE